jgi:hypothetical protein
MNAHPERSSARRHAGLVRRLVAPTARVSEFEQSSAQRARVDTSKWAGAAPIAFGLVTTTSIAMVGVLAALLPSGLSLVARFVVGVAGACVGFLLPVGALFVFARLTAPRRQRDEARAELRRLTEPVDVSELADTFSSWVLAKRASLPRIGFRVVLRHSNSEARVLNQEDRDEIERLHARARTEYHERFRTSLVDVLGEDANDPQTIAELDGLAGKLRGIADQKRRADLVATAQGRQVGPAHRSLLGGLLESVQLAVLNGRVVDYSDAPDGEPQNQDSFAAHFESLMPTLDEHRAAVQQLELATQSLRGWVEHEVHRRGFTKPGYLEGTVTECFSEISVDRALRGELSESLVIHLRCVEGITTPEGEKYWSANLHSGRREVKVAQLRHVVKEFSEEGMAPLNRIIAGMDRDLQACFDAIQDSDAAAEVAASRDALRELRQPLMDRLKRLRIAFDPVFTGSCPFCLAEVGL